MAGPGRRCIRLDQEGNFVGCSSSILDAFQDRICLFLTIWTGEYHDTHSVVDPFVAAWPLGGQKAFSSTLLLSGKKGVVVWSTAKSRATGSGKTSSIRTSEKSIFQIRYELALVYKLSYSLFVMNAAFRHLDRLTLTFSAHVLNP
jgi:hypothetical protein